MASINRWRRRAERREKGREIEIGWVDHVTSIVILCKFTATRRPTNWYTAKGGKKHRKRSAFCADAAAGVGNFAFFLLLLFSFYYYFFLQRDWDEGGSVGLDQTFLLPLSHRKWRRLARFPWECRLAFIQTHSAIFPLSRPFLLFIMMEYVLLLLSLGLLELPFFFFYFLFFFFTSIHFGPPLVGSFYGSSSSYSSSSAALDLSFWQFPLANQ